MENIATFVGTVHLLAGLLLIGLAVPLIARRVPMNRWYGMRIRKSFSSDANWYSINSVGGWWLMLAGAVLTSAGIVGMVSQPEGEVAWVLWGAAPMIVVALVIVPVLLYARRLE